MRHQTTSFKIEISIATGDIVFDPTLANYQQQLLFGRRSNFVRNLFLGWRLVSHVISR